MHSKEKDTTSLEPAKSTSTLDRFMQGTSHTSQSTKTQQKSIQKNSQTLTYSPQDSLVRLFRWLENGSDLKTCEAHYFMKLLGLQEKNDLAIYYLRMSQDSNFMTKEGHSKQSSPSWMSWGMMQNGKVSTANISFHKTGNGSSLSDILEGNIPDKYFLSETAVQGILTPAKNKKRRGIGSKSNCWSNRR